MITDQQANSTNETSKTDHKGKYRTLSFLIELNKFCVIFLFSSLTAYDFRSTSSQAKTTHSAVMYRKHHNPHLMLPTELQI
jgi:hypothetical protein